MAPLGFTGKDLSANLVMHLMAPGEHKPTPKTDKLTLLNSARAQKGVLDEGPKGVRKLSRLERTQHTLRILSAKISKNNLLSDARGTINPTQFVLNIVKSTKGVQDRLFDGEAITLIESRDTHVIEVPRDERGRLQPPIVASYFILGDKSPEALSKNAELSKYVHNCALEFSPLSGKKALYLIPVESGIISSLIKVESKESERECLVDLSKFVRYLPSSTPEARALLLNYEVHAGAELDIDRIHDNLSEITLVTFSGGEEKTQLPFAILKLEGGATFHLYPYGESPSPDPPPQGCEIICAQNCYYLLIPELVVRQRESQEISKTLSL